MSDLARPPAGLILPVTIAIVASASLLTVGLLTAGTLTHHVGLLTWSMVTGMASLDLMVLLVVKKMMNDAVRQCADAVAVDTTAATKALVEETAVRVGQAIAESLRDDEQEPSPPAPRAEVRTIY